MAAASDPGTDTRPALAALLQALDDLDVAAEANAVRAAQIRLGIQHIRDELAAGESLAQIVADEPRPLIVELITENIDTLNDAGSAFRRAEAAALRDEGLTVERIAGLFGVSRQRVSALLQVPVRRHRRRSR